MMGVAQVRHLEGMSGNFAVSESEYVSAFGQDIDSASLDVVLRSNVKEMVGQQQDIFDAFWQAAIPAEQRIMELEGGITPEKAEIFYGAESTTPAAVGWISRVRKNLDAVVDSASPSVFLEVQPFRNAYINAKERGVKIRWVTDITKENLPYCKELMKYVEVRHLTGTKGNYGISESEYAAAATLEEAKPIPLLITSTVKSFREQQQYIFDTLWKMAVPVEHRIKEIEEGIVPVETKVLEEPDDILERIAVLHENSGEVMVASTVGVLRLIHDQFFDIYKKLMARKAGGNHRGVRWTMFIDKGSIDIVKTFLGIGVEIRHVKNMPSTYFAVSDKMYNATVETMEDSKMIQSLLTSTEPLYVQHFKSVFEELWKNGIDAVERIQDIEAGRTLDSDIIISPLEAQQVYRSMIDEAKEAIKLILPTISAFKREQKTGIINALVQASARGAKVRVLMPVSDGYDSNNYYGGENAAKTAGDNNNHNNDNDNDDGSHHYRLGADVARLKALGIDVHRLSPALHQ